MLLHQKNTRGIYGSRQLVILTYYQRLALTFGRGR